MPKTATLNIRLEPKIKTAAEKVLSALGLTHTQAVDMLYRQIIIRKGLPFTLDFDYEAWSKLPESPNKPNALTEETMRRTNAGEDLHKAKDFEDLMKQLNA